MEFYVFVMFIEYGLDVFKVKQMKFFCVDVGYQLLGYYFDGMCISYGWGFWVVEKQRNVVIGMYGLGLIYVFGYLILKVLLFLYWGVGEVIYNGKCVIWWFLLFNS